MSSISAPRRRLAILLVAVLVAALGGMVTTTATAGKPSGPTGNDPTGIVINRVSSDIAPPSGLPSGAAPYVIVTRGGDFFVEVSFTDDRGRSASFDAPTTLSLSLSSSSNHLALLTSTDVTVAKGERTAVLTGSISEATNQVVLTVETVGDLVLTGHSSPDQQFDVLSTSRTDAPAAERGIGGLGDCTSATAEAPVCGTLLLPKGAASPTVFMSLGACDSTYAGCGTRLGGSIVQVLADLTAPNPNPNRPEIDLYTKSSPATLIIRCDTTLCETGAIQGIPVNFSLSGNGALGPAPACPRKNTVGGNQDVCVDYVQSKRDGSSDTILYLLFTRDLRGGIG